MAPTAPSCRGNESNQKVDIKQSLVAILPIYSCSLPLSWSYNKYKAKPEIFHTTTDIKSSAICMTKTGDPVNKTISPFLCIGMMLSVTFLSQIPHLPSIHINMFLLRSLIGFWHVELFYLINTNIKYNTNQTGTNTREGQTLRQFYDLTRGFKRRHSEDRW